jgi:hypothetical protein
MGRRVMPESDDLVAAILAAAIAARTEEVPDPAALVSMYRAVKAELKKPPRKMTTAGSEEVREKSRSARPRNRFARAK